MPKSKSLHAILGTGGRVRKPRASRSTSASASPAASPNRTGLQRQQQQQAAHTGSPVKRGPSAVAGRHVHAAGNDDRNDDRNDDEEEEEGQWDLEDEFDYFADELDDNGLVHAFATDLSLSDVAQAMRIARARMFSPVPLRGLRSARIPALHARRATCPPLTMLAHLHALLASPSAAERELATLVRGGVVRRVAVARTSEVEMLVLENDLEGLLGAAAASERIGEGARAEFVEWLKRNPGESVVAKGELNAKAADELVREGFLTAKGYGGMAMTAGERERLRLRPDERTSLVSLDRVSRAASGSVAAVGGTGVVYEAGGGGSRSHRTTDTYKARNNDSTNKRSAAAAAAAADRTPHDLDLAVPGQGTFLRLATAAVEHLVGLIRNRSKFAQAPESTLREWWDCATPAASKSEQAARRRNRKKAASSSGGGWSMGNVGVVMPDRTTKWRLLDGVSFEWALEEAVGMGLVEMFDAGSIGRGVRVV